MGSTEGLNANLEIVSINPDVFSTHSCGKLAIELVAKTVPNSAWVKNPSVKSIEPSR